MNGRARGEDGTWDHVALRSEHRALINAGSLAPTRKLATKYGVSTMMIKEVLDKNITANAGNHPPILCSHHLFER